MSSKVRIATAFFGFTLISALLPLFFGPSEASAAPICTGGTGAQTQSQVVVLGDCSNGGGGGTRTLPPPKFRAIKWYPERTCFHEGTGQQSMMGVVWDSVRQTSYETCLRPRTIPGGGNVLDTTQLTINAPKPTADFAERFLTGAEVQFTVPDMTSYVQGLRQFPGATVVATPVRMDWDFGDGTKSSELEPKHTFLTKSPNPNDPNDNTVHVRVAGTWHLYLHPPDAAVDNPVQDLGEVTLTGQLDRPIVEVWSAQTEPKS